MTSINKNNINIKPNSDIKNMSGNKIYGYSWGGYPKTQQLSFDSIFWRSNVKDRVLDLINSNKSILPIGNLRSYGDSCLSSSGVLFDNKKLNKIIEFDESNQTIKVESGILLSELIEFLVPFGLFPPVVPGTKYITLGGAIANDIHGKNHHSAGSIGCFAIEFELINETGQFVCSKNENQEFFYATIGGLGLTGYITWVKLKLKKIENSYIKNEGIKFKSLEDFFAINNESINDYEYTVAWLDISSNPKTLGRGIYLRGNHVTNDELKTKEYLSIHQNGKNLPLTPELINTKTINIFNKLYFNKQISHNQTSIIHYDKYFFPLDGVGNWNKLYGKKGFLQYQFVLPFSMIESENVKLLRLILELINKSGFVSFLTVLKTFGNKKSGGLLSFPKEGITLAIDFKIDKRFNDLLRLLDKLDTIITENNGSIYIAKDARMSADTFKKSYPQLNDFQKYKSPYFTSDFWQRVYK